MLTVEVVSGSDASKLSLLIPLYQPVLKPKAWAKAHSFSVNVRMKRIGIRAAVRRSIR
jgi:hypothetical protein